MEPGRRLPVGAEVVPGGVHFRVWAPRRREVSVVIDSSPPLALQREKDGYFSALVAGIGEGARYRYLLDGEGPFPDPASRFQPEGPHGPSQVVDPGTYRWKAKWRGLGEGPHVLYEMHIGTLTSEGTFVAAIGELPRVVDLGITIVEVMPVSEFPGRFGWGYDGVDWFAPTRLYGTPDDFRAFIDRAHELGLAVILDVVYNHLGPDGNYLSQFSDQFFDPELMTEWGPAINYANAGAREFILSNVRYWIDEFRLDGLRLDATHAMQDRSKEHILAAIAREARRAAGKRRIFISSENEAQWSQLARDFGHDAIWNDDFHHTAFVAATGRREAYFTDYLGSPQELLSALRWGFLFQGCYYVWQKQPRGSPALDLPAQAFVHYLENHDQIANTGFGDRLHLRSSAARVRALTAVLLLGPQTPLLFQGQEYQSSSPFRYFADHPPELATLVSKGRKEFLRQFPSLATAAAQEAVPEPSDPQTFLSCKLEGARRPEQQAAWRLHRDLLKLRREDPVFRAGRSDWLHGAILGPHAFVARFRGPAERLLIVNLGPTLPLSVCPEPLLAPPTPAGWKLLWSSESPEYGGGGALHPLTGTGSWLLPAESATVLASGGS